WQREKHSNNSIRVSESGEQCSPKTPPLKTDAIVNAIEISIDAAIGIAIGIMIANVPYDVPVVKAMMEPKTNSNTGITAGDVVCSAKSIKYSAVPSSVVTVPIDQASVKMI